MINVTRTIHPVGQGLFCTEKFYNDEQQSLFNIVYDCGAFQPSKHSQNQLFRDYLGIKNGQKVKLPDISQYNKHLLHHRIEQAFPNNETIDLAFISHFHYDHICGFPELIRNRRIKNLVLPQLTDELLVESIVFNYSHFNNDSDVNTLNDTNDFLIKLRYHKEDLNECHILEVKPSNVDIKELGICDLQNLSTSTISNTAIRCQDIWEYIPFCMYGQEFARRLFDTLQKDSNFGKYFESFDEKSIRNFITEVLSNTKGRKAIKKLYHTIAENNNQNEYSMPVYSGPIVNDDVFIRVCHTHCHAPYHPHCHICCDMDCCAPDPDSGSLANCLYTGDFNASSKKPYYNSMVQFYHHTHHWERIKMIQVPHHGSKHSHNTDLYKERCFAFISCGLRNQYHHPHAECVAGIITTGCHCSIVNEYCQPLKMEMHIH